MVIIVTLFACNNATQPISVLIPGDRIEELIELARTETQKSRDLTFIRPVKTGMITRDQFRRLYNSESSSSQYELIMNAFKQYGFVPDTMSSSKYIASYNENFAAAFYKNGSDSLYIIDVSEYNDASLFALASHEFTHALQEQHFNPFANQNYPGLVQSSLSSDYYLSQLCITEGDANVSGLYTLYKFIYQEAGHDTTDSLIRISESDFYTNIKSTEAPGYLDIQGYAPYEIGAGYVWDIFTKGKWDAVNRLFHADRPISTRQIITRTAHTPWSFDFSAIMPVLLSNTTKLIFADDDTYGPIMLMALLNKYVDAEHCKAALGWQGDRCAFTLSDNQKWGSFVWALKFDTPENTEYVYERLDSLYTNRNLGQLTATRIADTSGISYSNANSQLFLRKSGTFIFIMDNVSSKSTVLAALDKPSAVAKKDTHYTALSPTADIRVKHQIIDMIIGR
ncbi:MAG: hypothetical protein GX639_22295 [Fibrobacter sp.]|nr:hypothetical protein [Fibrobacter sp.]